MLTTWLSRLHPARVIDASQAEVQAEAIASLGRRLRALEEAQADQAARQRDYEARTETRLQAYLADLLDLLEKVERVAKRQQMRRERDARTQGSDVPVAPSLFELKTGGRGGIR